MAGGLDRHLWQLLRHRSVDYLKFVGKSVTLTTAITKLMTDTSDKVLMASGITVPALASTGYSKGCLFFHTDAATGLPGLYTNIGTNTSCNFVALGQLNTTVVDITNAELKGLVATVKTLVAAPGVGYYLEFCGGQIFLDYATNGLTETDDNLVVRWGAAAGTIASQVIEMTGFIDQTADMYTTMLPKVDAITTPVLIANLPLVLQNNGHDFAGNAGLDCVLQVRTNYRVWPILD
jgi:hypothetical protein